MTSQAQGNVEDIVERFQRKYVEDIPLQYFQNRFFEYPDPLTEADKFEFFKYCFDLQNDCNWYMIYDPEFSSTRIKFHANFEDFDFFILEETIAEDPFTNEIIPYWYGISYCPAESYLEIFSRKCAPEKLVLDSPFAGKTILDLALYLAI